MPELPEVETVVRQLRPQLLGARIAGVTVQTPKLIRCQSVPMENLAGATITEIDRRGKFIRCRLSNQLTLLVHLRMTGRLTVFPDNQVSDRHDHIDLRLKDRRVLRFRDVRKFGGWWVMTTAEADREPPISQLGPEPLEVSRDEFRGILRGRRQRIKALLLDQTRLAGMGNIYCDEALFASGIHPAALACRLSPARVDRLWQQMRRILRLAIRHQGSTVSDYQTPDGQRGRYQERHRVYGRAGEPCFTCHRPLRRAIVAGRGTTFCPRCQK
jgi:formamidopyrimidine-DNA glycosylase